MKICRIKKKTREEGNSGTGSAECQCRGAKNLSKKGIGDEPGGTTKRDTKWMALNIG